MMKSSMNATSLHQVKGPGRVLIAALILAAVLTAFLALHSMGGPHAVASPSTHAQANVEHVHAAEGLTAQSGNSAVAAVSPHLTCEEGGAVECTVMAVMCVLLLVIAAHTILARRPALKHRLTQAVTRAVQAVAAARQHVYLPSLTFLSISRT